ncbi:MAG: hypothetical protein PHE84_09360 [bacterium]|nr:hypothetical protein [bacterium]
MDAIFSFFQTQFNLFRDNLLSPKLDHYALYALIFSFLLLVLFSICLILKKEKFILPALLLGLLLTPGFYYLRELSPWSRYLKNPPPSSIGNPALPKLGEAQVIDGQVIMNPKQGETPATP